MTSGKSEHQAKLTRRLNGVAHELNNTLNAITLRLAVLMDDPVFSGQRPNLEALARIVRDATGLVDRLRELTKERSPDPLQSI